MTDWVIPLSKAAAQFEGLKAEMKAAAYKGLVAAGARGLQVLVVEIIPKRSPQPVDRGVFRAGWKLRIGPDYVEIYNDEPTAALIEEGVRGDNVKTGARMIAALAEWALRKGLASDSKEAISVAWAVAKSMQKKGIFNRDGKSGLGILRELVEWHLDNIIEQEVLRALGQI